MFILKSEFGSVVYGTKIPTSDTDYKGIILPTAEQILLQRVPKQFNENTKKNSSIKNTKDDVDFEIWGIQKYLELLLSGQTPCIDLLFTPKKHWITYTSIWENIIDYKDKWLSNNIKPFVSYCRTQAAKYGLKGTRMAAIKATLDIIKQFDVNSIFIDYKEIIEKFVKDINNEHINIVLLQNAQKTGLEPFLEICNRKFAFHIKVKYVLERLTNIYEEYGHRARQAEKNEGIDYKALYHAVRVSEECKELLLTGNITFPRPEAKLLLDIRKEIIPYNKIASIIENNLEEIEKIKSVLPDKPDYQFADNFIKEVYLGVLK